MSERDYLEARIATADRFLSEMSPRRALERIGIKSMRDELADELAAREALACALFGWLS